MFIQTETTPNPATLKFLPGQPVLPGGTREFTSTDDTDVSPLAKKLFALDGIKAVFFGNDFISVTKKEEADWDMVKTYVLGEIMQHFASGLPVMEEGAGAEKGADSSSEDDDEITSQIKEILDTRVRPAVAQDGGDITFVKFEDGVVYLQMMGACSGCPSSTATLKSGIENMLRHYVPEVARVEPINPYG